jgi:hypothetical protein
LPLLRNDLFRDCELRAVISLPRVFKNNNARMAVLYLARNPEWNWCQRILLATIDMRWTDEDGDDHATDLFAALEALVDRYKSHLEPANSALPPGRGMLEVQPPATAGAEDAAQ